MIRIYIIICFATINLFFSCSWENKSNIQDEFYTVPDIIKQEQEIEICLNKSDINNEVLYLKIGSFNHDGYHTEFRIPFKKKNGIFKAKYSVPHNSTFIKIDYEIKNEINEFKSIFRTVYKDDKPSLIGSVLSLKNSADLKELESQHKFNEKIYPDNKLSWAMYYYLRKRILGLRDLPNESDSVFKVVKNTSIRISKEDMFDNLSACFMGYCLEKNWENASVILKDMKQDKYKNTFFSYLAQYNIAMFLLENSVK